jgi:hypothetical protein
MKLDKVAVDRLVSDNYENILSEVRNNNKEIVKLYLMLLCLFILLAFVESEM